MKQLHKVQVQIMHDLRKWSQNLGHASHIYIIHGLRKCQNKLGSWISYIYIIHALRKCKNSGFPIVEQYYFVIIVCASLHTQLESNTKKVFCFVPLGLSLFGHILPNMVSVFCTWLRHFLGGIYPKCDAIVRKDWKA